MIKVCTCKHEGQDQLHGKNLRVMNLCKGNTEVRCTVCSKQYMVGTPSKDKK